MAKIYGALEVAQIEWFTQSPDTRPSASANIYRVIYASDVKQIQISDGTSWRVSNINFFTSGTLPAAGATNQYQIAFLTDTLQIKVSNGTKWTTVGARLDVFTSGTIPAAASNANQMIWVSDLQQLQVSNGTAWVQVGSKAGTKNYFSQSNANPDFETNSVSPWSACTLTFSGGAPSGAPTLSATQMSIAATATTPLSGTYSMLLTKSAANAQYQGFISGVLTIDRSDLAKVLYGSFAYEVTSASNTVDFSGSSTQSLEIWVYNVNAGTWIQPAGYRGMNQSAGSGKVTFSFQTDSTVANNQYRIAVITQQTSATAYTVEFDDFQIGPSAIVLGAAMTDWQSYTPVMTVGSGTLTNATPTGRWRRVGDSIEVTGKLVFSSTSSAFGSLVASLPSGLNIDLSKLSSGTQFTLGDVTALDATVANYVGGNVILNNATSVALLPAAINTHTGTAPVFSPQFSNTFPITFNTNDEISWEFKAPIAGWSSNVQMSNDTDTRVVDFVGTAGSGQVLTANTTNISVTASKDSHGAWGGSSYTVPVSGDYVIAGALQTGGAQTVQVYKNSVAVTAGTWSTAAATQSGAGSVLIPNCVSGDILSIRTTTSVTVTVAYLSIQRLSGPSVVAANESVNASYFNTAGTVFTAGTTTIIPFATKVFDSHSAFVTNTYTVPISGKYLINSAIFGTGINAQATLMLYKNGSFYGGLASSGPVNGSNILSGMMEVSCNSGETLAVYLQLSASGGNVTLIVTSGYNHIDIQRIGN